MNYLSIAEWSGIVAVLVVMIAFALNVLVDRYQEYKELLGDSDE